MIPFAQLRWIAIQHESTSLGILLYIVVMYIVTRNSRCIARLNSIFRLIDAWGGVDNLELILGAKYRLCSRSLESASRQAQVVFHPDGGRSDCCLHQILNKTESLSIRSATASCRSSRNGAFVGNPGETFRQLQSSRCFSASRFLDRGHWLEHQTEITTMRQLNVQRIHLSDEFFSEERFAENFQRSRLFRFHKQAYQRK